MITAAISANMKDLQITTNLPCLMVTQKCSLEEGVGNLRLDEEGVALDRKAHTTEQKKLYKKHHLIRGILVAALPHKEYLKMSDKSTSKAMFTSLCAIHWQQRKPQKNKITLQTRRVCFGIAVYDRAYKS